MDTLRATFKLINLLIRKKHQHAMEICGIYNDIIFAYHGRIKIHCLDNKSNMYITQDKNKRGKKKKKNTPKALLI